MNNVKEPIILDGKDYAGTAAVDLKNEKEFHIGSDHIYKPLLTTS